METKAIAKLENLVEEQVPPSGGSLEIGNVVPTTTKRPALGVPPSGGSLEIGNLIMLLRTGNVIGVPPSGGSLEIGNLGV